MNEKLDDIFSSSPNDISEELLIRYVEGNVTSEERRRIERRLTDDPFLSDAVEGLMAKRDSVKHRSILQEIHKKIDAHSSARMFKILPAWSVIQTAAAVIVIFIAAWFVNYLIKKPDNKIFTEEFKPYPAAPALQNATPEISSAAQDSVPKQIVAPPSPSPTLKSKQHVEVKNAIPNEAAPQRAPESLPAASAVARIASNIPADQQRRINDGLASYKAGNYPQAITQFDSVLMNDSLNEMANFYSGVSYLAINDDDHALKNLEHITSQSEYYEASLWYQSLAYLHKDARKECIELLQKIITLNGNYRSQAENLLKELE